MAVEEDSEAASTEAVAASTKVVAAASIEVAAEVVVSAEVSEARRADAAERHSGAVVADRRSVDSTIKGQMIGATTSTCLRVALLHLCH